MRDRCEASPMTASSAHHVKSTNPAQPDQQKFGATTIEIVTTRSLRTGPMRTSTNEEMGTKASRAFSKRGEGGRDDIPKRVKNTRRDRRPMIGSMAAAASVGIWESRNHLPGRNHLPRTSGRYCVAANRHVNGPRCAGSVRARYRSH